MTSTLTPGDLWADIEAVRTPTPLGHNNTNLVVVKFNANTALAAGPARDLWRGQPEDAPKPMVIEQFLPFVSNYEFFEKMGVKIAPIQAQASAAIAASGIIGSRIPTRSPRPTPS